MLEELNRSLFLLVNASESTPAWVIRAAIYIADYAILAIPLVLVGLWLRANEKDRQLALRACIVTFVTLGLNQVLAVVFPHPRPFMAGIGHTFVAHAPDSSFPSDHMTVFAGCAIVFLSGGLQRLGLGLLSIGAVVGWSRLALGVHFPIDMLGAVMAAYFVHLLIIPIWKRLGESILAISESLYRMVLAIPIERGWLPR